MADRHGRARWQSVTETVALVAAAGAVVWMAATRTQAPPPALAAPPPAAARPEAPLPSEPVSLDGAQLLGERTAQIGLVVYSDFECPYCGRFARETLPGLEDQYVGSGQVLLAFRQYPLPIHANAAKAAEAAECAGRQGGFWEFHDKLFENPKALDAASLRTYAAGVGLDEDAFARCLDGQASDVVQADRVSGSAAGVSGTPTFLVGELLADGRLKVSQRFSGAKPLSEFQAILDRVLESAGSSGAQ